MDVTGRIVGEDRPEPLGPALARLLAGARIVAAPRPAGNSRPAG